jgi:hypothetical protein
MKDTAVKFLIDEISCRFIISEELRIAMYKAIEMEKEQIIDAYDEGDNNGADRIYYHSDRDDKSAEQYYNETFKPEII